jgi:hypothetical protein
MRIDVQAADRTPAVQKGIMKPLLPSMIKLLSPEVPFDHELTTKEIVPFEGHEDIFDLSSLYALIVQLYHGKIS